MAGTSEVKRAAGALQTGATPAEVSGSGATLWQQTAREASSQQSLTGDVDCDVVVVGAGYTGCSCALTLACGGADVVVLEAGEPGAGASGRNAAGYAGMWTATLPAAITATFGEDQGARMNTAIAGGAEYLHELVREFGLQVDLNPCGILMAAHKPAARAGLEEMARQWSALGNPMESVDSGELARLSGTKRHAGGILLRQAGTLNPMALARGLARAARQCGARVFTGVRAQSLHRAGGGWGLVTPAGEVRARAVVLATHTDGGQLWPGLAGSYYRLPLAIVATAPLAAAQAAALLPGGMPLADSSPYNLFWIMLDRDRRLVASLPPSLLHPGSPPRVAAPLQARLQRLFPGVGELPWDNTWSGWIDLVPDRLPRIFRPEPNLYVPLGYSGQGIVNATVLGRELGSAIAKDSFADCAFAVTDIHPAPLAGLLPRLVQGIVFPLIRAGNRLFL